MIMIKVKWEWFGSGRGLLKITHLLMLYSVAWDDWFIGYMTTVLTAGKVKGWWISVSVDYTTMPYQLHKLCLQIERDLETIFVWISPLATILLTLWSQNQPTKEEANWRRSAAQAPDDVPCWIKAFLLKKCIAVIAKQSLMNCNWGCAYDDGFVVLAVCH
jgi:hypothetical protein